MASEIRNQDLWQDGRLKIDWVRHHMPLLNGLEEEFRQTLPFKGKKVALSVHLEAKTAYLCEVLAAGGAEMYVTGSNPLSTRTMWPLLLSMPDSMSSHGMMPLLKNTKPISAGCLRWARTSSSMTEETS